MHTSRQYGKAIIKIRTFGISLQICFDTVQVLHNELRQFSGGPQVGVAWTEVARKLLPEYFDTPPLRHAWMAEAVYAYDSMNAAARADDAQVPPC